MEGEDNLDSSALRTLSCQTGAGSAADRGLTKMTIVTAFLSIPFSLSLPLPLTSLCSDNASCGMPNCRQ
jgi:hypothetical protein